MSKIGGGGLLCMGVAGGSSNTNVSQAFRAIPAFFTYRTENFTLTREVEGYVRLRQPLSLLSGQLL